MNHNDRYGQVCKKSTHHLILCQCSSLVTEQVGNPAQLLWDRGASHRGSWDVLVSLDHPGVVGLAHVEVDSKTESNITVYYWFKSVY